MPGVLYHHVPQLSLAQARHLQHPLLVHVASRDPGLDSDGLDRAQELMDRAGRRLELAFWDAAPGFLFPDHADFSAPVATAAHQRTAQFLRSLMVRR